jgi:signal transduction histidine kinase
MLGSRQQSSFDEIGGSRTGRLPVVFAALVGVGVSALLGWMLSARDNDEIRRGLEAQTQSAAGQVRDAYRIANERLTAIRSFYAASLDVTRGEFSQFIGASDPSGSVLTGFIWAPMVRDSERAAFEQAVRTGGIENYVIRDRRPDGLTTRAGKRETYAPILFAEPMEQYESALGVDVMSLPGRKAVLDQADESGGAISVRLPPEEGQPGAGTLMVYEAIYRREMATETAEERRAALQGFVSVAVSLDGLIAPMLSSLKAGLAVEFFDEAVAGTEPFFSLGAESLTAGDRVRGISEAVAVGGDRWRLTVTPTRDYFAERPNAQVWIGVCLSLAFTTLVCAWIHSMAVRQREIAEIVGARTSELVIANSAMKQEVAVRRRAERELRAKTAELEAANREMESFSYSISHDLRAPLRAVTGFAGFVLRKHAERLPSDAVEHLQQVMKGGEQMNNLIEGLLDFSRVQRAELKRRNCDMSEMARAVLAEIQSTMPGRRVDIIWGRLPGAYGDPTLLRQVWQNLIGNALKYSGKREFSLIEIGSRDVDGEIEYYVRDNGAGFDMSQADRLFGVFQRFHSQSQFEGTGIGLANVHKIVMRHGGNIIAEAEVDKGATFRFTLGRRDEAKELDESGVFVTDTRIKK